MHLYHIYIWLVCVSVCIHDAAYFFAVVLMRHLCLSTSVSFSVDLCIYFCVSPCGCLFLFGYCYNLNLRRSSKGPDVRGMVPRAVMLGDTGTSRSGVSGEQEAFR